MHMNKLKSGEEIGQGTVMAQISGLCFAQWTIECVI